jgi:hypothetical protein
MSWIRRKQQDTGWVNLAALLNEGWSASAFFVRRENSVTTIRISNLAREVGAAPGVLTVPPGFVYPSSTFLFNAGLSPDSGEMRADVSSGRGLSLPAFPEGRSSGVTRFHHSFVTVPGLVWPS